MIHNYIIYHSPIGQIILASENNALTGLWFDGQKYTKPLSSDATPVITPVLEQTVQWLNLYFSGKDPGFTPQIRIETTPFRHKVYEILRRIPFGQTMTYGEIASEMTGPNAPSRMSAQAVGNAVGHNPIALIIPCHRVVGANGSLTGYAAGIERKRQLLKMENEARIWR